MKLDIKNKTIDSENVELISLEKSGNSTLVILKMLDMGHYCGYISTSLTEDEVYETYSELPIEVTYEGKLFDNVKQSFIGWDYAHAYNQDMTLDDIKEQCNTVLGMFVTGTAIAVHTADADMLHKVVESYTTGYNTSKQLRAIIEHNMRIYCDYLDQCGDKEVSQTVIEVTKRWAKDINGMSGDIEFNLDLKQGV